ncbi:MAG TPA: hypothetical protein VFI91_01185 [Longimicrobiaceae bacterium]|nr:hypothetical protein [Longimicrobiaceae bacterium]
MFWLFVVALWTVMLLSPVLLLYLFLPSGRECPRCANETLRIRSRWLRPVRSVACLRWCMGCGWEGIVRTAIVHHPLPRFEVVPDDSQGGDEDATWRSADS